MKNISPQAQPGTYTTHVPILHWSVFSMVLKTRLFWLGFSGQTPLLWLGFSVHAINQAALEPLTSSPSICFPDKLFLQHPNLCGTLNVIHHISSTLFLPSLPSIMTFCFTKNKKQFAKKEYFILNEIGFTSIQKMEIRRFYIKEFLHHHPKQQLTDAHYI